MPVEWPLLGVDDVRRETADALATGPFGSSVNAKFFRSTGIPLIRGSNLSTAVNDRLVEDEFVFVSEEKAAEFPRAVVRAGDLVFTCWGTLGQVGLIDARARYARYLISNKQMKLSPDPTKADPLFLYYLFKSPLMQATITNVGIGSSVPGFNLGQLRGLRFPLPPLKDQRAIASVLGALDDKIAQNRRTSEALERLARAMFRAWFVDFEPVKAKAAGATSFPSMPQHVFDALPTRLVDSDLGPVPQGWEVKPLAEVVQLTMGQSPSSEFYNERGEGLPFHQGVTDYGFRFPTHRVYCTAEGRIAEETDVLLSVRAPVGRINVADRRLILGRGLAGLRHRGGRQSLLLQQMRHVFCEEDAIGDGTIYKAVTKQFLASMPTLSPPDKIQEAFETMTRPMDDLVMSTEGESRKLAQLRDYLLPKLLSGDVRVRTREQNAIVPEAG